MRALLPDDLATPAVVVDVGRVQHLLSRMAGRRGGGRRRAEAAARDGAGVAPWPVAARR